MTASTFRLFTADEVSTFALLLFALELVALASVPSVLLRRRGSPYAALAWLFGLFAAPGLGVFLWWLIGRTRIERKRRKQAKKRRAFDRIRQGSRTTKPNPVGLLCLLPERSHGVFAFAATHNSITLLRDGKEAFPALEKAIGEATASIQLLFYIFETDETGLSLAKKLILRAEEGVSVLVLVDGVGSGGSIRKLRRIFEGSKVRFEVFSPFRFFPPSFPRLNFVNHRKLVVIDQRIAFTGGMNIANEYRDSWRDLFLRIEGPAASYYSGIFLEDWFFATNETIPDPEDVELAAGGDEVTVVASGPDSEPWIHDLYFVLLTRAQNRIWLATPYFIPPAPLLTALRTAAGRGVDVRIILPKVSDVPLVRLASRSYYRILVAAGVRIFEFEGPMLHAKALLIDEKVFAVGTANIDSRSLGLSYEVTTFVESQKCQKSLEEYLAVLVAGSSGVELASLEKKPTLEKLAESAAHLLSPIL